MNEPFQFISIMFAKLSVMIDLHQNNKAICQNPILFDASCNGIQHLSALTLDKELARNVNLYSQSKNPKEELPQDFYIFVLKIIQKKLTESNILELNNIILNRKMIKKSIMTIPYNISMSGVADQLMEHLEKVWELDKLLIKIPAYATMNNKEIFLSPKQYGELIKIIYFVLTKELPSLRALSEYFDSLIEILVNLDQPITWVTPAGLRIKYSNIKFHSVRTKTKLIKNRKIKNRIF